MFGRGETMETRAVEEEMDLRGQAAIEAECERWRRAVELDPSSGSKALEAVQWSVSVLRQMEDQERCSGDKLDINMAGAGVSSDHTTKKDEQASHIVEEVPALCMDDDDAEGENAGTGQERGPPTQKVLRASGRKRKSGDIFPGKKARESERNELGKSDMNKREVDCLEGAVKEAESGKAGTIMAERVEAWMVRLQCHTLVNLISHCLNKSLDQHSPIEGSVGDKSCKGSEGEQNIKAGLYGKAIPKREDGVRSVNDSVWLHKWLVKEVMQSTTDIHEDSMVAHRSPLDWLVAHLTAASPKLFVAVVLDDLVDNVVTCNAKRLVSLSIYVRRVGILEYAALRVPEQIATGLQMMLSNLRSMVVVKYEEGRSDLQGRYTQRPKEIMCVWLVMATLCPQFLGACFRYWKLTVETIKSFQTVFAGILKEDIPPLPLWSVLEDGSQEEPRSILTWFSAILSRRLAELAPVGADLLLLLSRLMQPSSTDRADRELTENAAFLLNVLYSDLAKSILPRVIGAQQITGAEPLSSITKDEEQTGEILFVDNLKNDVNKIWAELLNVCSESTCQCCETASSHSLCLDSSQDTGKKLAGNGTGPSQASLQTNAEGRGCANSDPFVGVCHLAIMSCGNFTLAELLAEATVITPCSLEGFERKSLRRLLVVMEVMRMVAGQGRGAQVFEIWAHLSVTFLTKSMNEQALHRALAIQQLLDPRFWQSHQRVPGPSSRPVQVTDIKQEDDNMKGLSWKVVWTLLRKVLDFQWLQLVPLLHRKNAWELQLVVLYVLQFLSPDNDSRPQTVVVQLKGLLGIFFQWLDESAVDRKDVEKIKESGRGEQVDKWQRVRALEQLKRVIVQQASSGFATFTLMVSSLLDYSFELSAREAEASSLPNNHGRMKHSGNMQRRGLGGSGRGSFPISTLVAGRLDPYGNFTLLSGPTGKENGSTASQRFSLAEEIRKMKSGGLSSLDVYERERLGPSYRNGDPIKPLGYSLRGDYGTETDDSADVTMMELKNLLRRTMTSAVSKAAEKPNAWSPHPANILANLIIDRLETPHEMAMTMEQYEEVLPKQVSSPRHIFLTDCFSHNQLLFETLELVVKYRESDEMLRCVEFIRVLLADNISRWHSAYRTRRNPDLPPPRVSEEERLDRMQVGRLISLVADAGWLPQPLASTIEILEVIDGADIADLLLLVWRCMHHAMAFGAKSWGGLSGNITPQGGVPADVQMQGVEDESSKEGTYTEWEGHLFAILRQNIAQIGGHFAQVYPVHRSF